MWMVRRPSGAWMPQTCARNRRASIRKMLDYFSMIITPDLVEVHWKRYEGQGFEVVRIAIEDWRLVRDGW